MTCANCGGEFEGPARHFGWYVMHMHESDCAYVFRAETEVQRRRAVAAESTVALLVEPFNRPEGVYGQ